MKSLVSFLLISQRDSCLAKLNKSEKKKKERKVGIFPNFNIVHRVYIAHPYERGNFHAQFSLCTILMFHVFVTSSSFGFSLRSCRRICKTSHLLFPHNDLNLHIHSPVYFALSPASKNPGRVIDAKLFN